MQDIFGSTKKISNGKIASTERAILMLNNEKLGLVQNLQATYQRQINSNFEVGSADVYFVSGRAMGQVSVSRIIGPRGLITKIANGTLGTGCSDNQLVIDLATACGDSSVAGLVLSGLLLQSYAIALNSADLSVTESINFLMAFMGE